MAKASLQGGPGTVRLSVVVCTYNRADLLPACLGSLAAQTAGRADFEVIVVNNNSTDGTQGIAEGFAGREANFRVVGEAAQGLSNARNRGWQEAKGAYVAYIDDDAKATPDWVARTLDFLKNHPGAAAVGGPYRAFSPVPVPNWFKVEWGSWSLCDTLGPISDEGWISGTNMVFRRDLLEATGGFDPALGMVGTQIGYGEEVALVRRLVREGHAVFFNPAMVVEHMIAPYKFRVRWWLASAYANGKAYRKMHRHERTSVLRALLRVGLEAYLALKRFALCGESHMKTRIIVAVCPLAWRVGILISVVGGRGAS